MGISPVASTVSLSVTARVSNFLDTRHPTVSVVFRTISPVSRSDLRLERMPGQPPETTLMNFDYRALCHIWWWSASRHRPSARDSIVQREYPLDSRPGLNSLRARRTILSTRRLGGSTSTISQVSASRPSGKTICHEEPAFQSVSKCMPDQYCLMKSGLVSAGHVHEFRLIHLQHPRAGS
jgi:hypothetical protein